MAGIEPVSDTTIIYAISAICEPFQKLKIRLAVVSIIKVDKLLRDKIFQE